MNTCGQYNGAKESPTGYRTPLKNEYTETAQMATPMPDPNSIIELGFRYMFKDEGIAPEHVNLAMTGQDGVVRYSQALSLSQGRSMAVVLFRCAQIVFRGRGNYDADPMKFDNKIIIKGDKIHSDADLTGEEVADAMQRLTDIGVFVRLKGEQSGLSVFTDWYIFADEEACFPPIGKAKFK